jgi:hypothetical protein
MSDHPVGAPQGPESTTSRSVPAGWNVVNTDDREPTTKYHDPAWLVQCAWSEFRLAKLQEMVKATITDLEQIGTSQLLGRDLAGLDTQFPENPVTEAVAACSHELRYESGVPDALASWIAHRELIDRCFACRPALWRTTFEEALQQCRREASQQLQTRIAREYATD